MIEYLNLLSNIYYKGEDREDRTGTGIRSLFGSQIEVDLGNGFPLLTTKRVHFKSIVYELLWMLKGDTNIKYLNDNGVTIWNEWADDNGDLGPIYGYQWRNVGKRFLAHGIDQIGELVDGLKNNPLSRRHVVSSWNPVYNKAMKLPPCHALFQVFVSRDLQHMDLKLYQRSCDFFLGGPFNIASYALLLEMLCHVTKRTPRRLIISYGDVHLYKNHLSQAREQMVRKCKPLPNISLNDDIKDIFKFGYEDIVLSDYSPHSKISAKVSV